jgi:tetratricopeptide (TPR) repeat protein
MRSPWIAVLACVLLGAPPAALAQSASPQPAAMQEARAHWPVQGADEPTQRLIDRGLLMLYAFDVGEARVAFAEVLARNPNVALAYWGEAEADTIDINSPQTSEGDKRGAAASAEGRRHLSGASETERMLVDAISLRYGRGTKKERFEHYADALSAWTKTHRDDANVLTVAAFAIWNAEDALFDGHDAVTPKTNEMIADLDAALALDPANVGAHHLRIHLMEELHRARDAVSDADALSSYSYPPGTSHLPHMSGHIWSRIGEYARLVADNERAVANDRAWFAQGDGPGQQYMKLYHDHDVDFVLYGLTTLGRNDEARAFAQHEDTTMQIKAAVRLHDDARVLRLTGADSTGSGALARLVAAARLGDASTARPMLAKLSDGGSAKLVGDAMMALLAHDTASRAADYARAYEATKNAALGDPKTSWQTPIGEGYGAALLAAGKPADAEAVFTAELKRYPNDPHLEWGLAEALKAQGKDDSAPRAAYHASWEGSRDLTLTDLG